MLKCYAEHRQPSVQARPDTAAQLMSKHNTGHARETWKDTTSKINQECFGWEAERTIILVNVSERWETDTDYVIQILYW